ncbi:hypothetical protein M9458_029356, partial [Cirrhinus mrigala]
MISGASSDPPEPGLLTLIPLMTARPGKIPLKKNLLLKMGTDWHPHPDLWTCTSGFWMGR